MNAVYTTSKGFITCIAWNVALTLRSTSTNSVLQKLIRKAFLTSHNGESIDYSVDRIFHCLDSLRQDVMCYADDTPIPAVTVQRVGRGQFRQCRSWDKLRAWATTPDLDACHRFDDYGEATNKMELFAFCPHNSPYRQAMSSYFEKHRKTKTQD